jgi:Ca2+-binding EF-hand superfamily protein
MSPEAPVPAGDLEAELDASLSTLSTLTGIDDTHELSLEQLQKLFENSGVETSRAVLVKIMTEVQKGKAILTLSDLKEWAQNFKWHSETEMYTSIAKSSFGDLALLGSISFFAGYFINFGNAFALWEATKATGQAACMLWLVGALLFVQVTFLTGEHAFITQEEGLLRLKSAVTSKKDDLNIDSDGDGKVSISELTIVFEELSLLLTDSQLKSMISAATLGTHDNSVSIPVLLDYLQGLEPSTANEMLQAVSLKVVKSASVYCLLCWVVGSALFFRSYDDVAFDHGITAGYVLFVIGYVGYADMVIDGIDANYEYLCSIKSSFRSFATTSPDALVNMIDTTGDGVIQPHEIRTFLDRISATQKGDIPTLSDAELEALIARIDEDGSGQMSTEEFSNFLKKLNNSGGAEKRIFITKHALMSPGLWALMFGLISCVIGLMQHHGAWETHTNVSKTCAFLSLISGFVPLNVYFEAKVRLFLRIETAKYNVVQQLKIQTKAANAAGLTGALQVAVGAAKHALQEAAGAAKHAMQGAAGAKSPR